MHTLIVIAHPDQGAFTHAVAQRVIAGIESREGDTHEIADLIAEGFGPRFMLPDYAVPRRTGSSPDSILAEQARIERADALVLVFPVY